MDLMVWVRPV
jgi:hypothetical protein